MDSKDGDDKKAQKIRDAFDWFMKLSTDELDLAIGKVKAVAYQKAFAKFQNQPQELQDKILQVDNAFTQLSQVKRLLEDKGDRLTSNEAYNRMGVGKKLFQERRYREAFEHLEKAIELGLETEEVFVLAATTALHAKQYAQAELYSTRALNLSPRNPHAMVLKGLSVRETDSAKALKFFEMALELRPDSKVIAQYRDEMLLKTNFAEKVNTDPMGRRRKWKRAPLRMHFQVNDMSSSMVFPMTTLSLSAGGCLVRAKEVPSQFQFSLDLRSSGHIWGTGEVAYRQDSLIGIRFINLGPGDQSKIDLEVGKHVQRAQA